MIRKAITDMGRGVTVYEGKKGYGKDGHINDVRDIIFTVATRLEIPSLKAKILDIDPSAFIVQQSIDDTTGGLLKKERASLVSLYKTLFTARCREGGRAA